MNVANAKSEALNRQKTQWPTIYKTLHRKQDTATRTPLKTGG